MPYSTSVYTNATSIIFVSGDEEHHPLISFDGGTTFYEGFAILNDTGRLPDEHKGVLVCSIATVGFYQTPNIVEAFGQEFILSATSFEPTGKVFVDAIGHAVIDV